MQIKSILLVIIALAAGAQAQRPKSPEGSSDQQTVTNEDRGRAFIIGREPSPSSGVVNRGTVILEPQQFSIFLGSGWATPSLREREAELANLLVNVRDQAMLNSLNESGVKSLFGPTSTIERLDDLSGNISDLAIQKILGAMVTDGSLPRSGASTIYVVFLDPEMHSTLGELVAEKHYAAYHNFFNTAGMRLHYVVVPYEADRKKANQIALRALVAAALTPTGAKSQ
ncbi:MAG: hypothetical protein ACMG6H_10085 [Acidobacteriota bacterium]